MVALYYVKKIGFFLLSDIQENVKKKFLLTGMEYYGIGGVVFHEMRHMVNA